MIQKLYWIASAFPSLAMTRGEGRETWVCSAPGAFPSLTMTIKGRGDAESKPAANPIRSQ